MDTETGHIRVDRVVSAHDVGQAINPQLVIGQIEGAVIQGHGYTLSETCKSSGRRGGGGYFDHEPVTSA